LSADGRAETDLIQVVNIDGLDPVKASVSTSPLGSVDGVVYTGSSVPSRNIVLTVRPNPDWEHWSHASLRRLLYSYFMPKALVRLIFTSDDLPAVEIYGIVEAVTANQFSKDPEFVVSIICPDPYFTAVEPEIVTGQSVRFGGASSTISYDGNVETGFYLKVTQVTDPTPTLIAIQVGDPVTSYFSTLAEVSATEYFEMNSLPRQKYVQNVDLNTGVIVNLLPLVEDGSNWPILQPGENDFLVITDDGVQDWELRYYERFGGL
jgi:hypothetical protein